MLIAADLQLGNEPITGAGAIGEQVAANVGNKNALIDIFSTQLSNIIAFITVLGGLFFVIYMLIAGFEWLQAGGDSGKVEKARNRMINGAIGLLVMVLAMGLLGIIGGVFGIDLLNPGAVFLKIIPNASGGP